MTFDPEFAETKSQDIWLVNKRIWTFNQQRILLNFCAIE